MKNQPRLRVYFLSHPILHTEWLTLLGDKYQGALAFTLEFSDSLENSDIVVWDGILTPKNSYYLQPLLEKIKADKILLLQGETKSLFKGHSSVKFIDLDQFKYVELPGFTVLPEALLGILNECFQRIQPHV